MAFADSSRVTTNILVVIGCVVASFSTRDPTPIQTRTEIVSVMNIPARAPEPAVTHAVNTQGALAMQVAAVVAPLPTVDPGSLPVAGIAAVNLAESNPLADPQPFAQPASSQAAMAAATATATRESAKPAAARRAVVTHRGDHSARPARQIAVKSPAGTHAARRKPQLHAARDDARNPSEPPPVPAVFVPIRNFGFFLQAKFTNAQDGCVAKADTRKQRGPSRPQGACR